MSWRGLGVASACVLAGLLAGAAVGAGVGLLADREPGSLDGSRPAAAVSPSFPTDPPVEILPDPLTPPLAPDLPSHKEKIGQAPFGLTVPVPDGWTRSNPKAGEWRWFVDGHPGNTYVLRIVLPSGYATIENSRDARIAALDGATGIQEFTLEEEYADGFVATYVLDGHRRLTMEKFISADDSPTVYATIALIGREVDRAGMADLLDSVATGARR